MKKEIKFRAWNGEEIIYEGGKQFMYYRHSYDILKSYEIVMQFIGFKDINGTEIYEGDIFKTINNLKGEKVICPELKTDERRPTLYGVNKKFEYFDNYESETQLEVIGNIFQNPELITIKNN